MPRSLRPTPTEGIYRVGEKSYKSYSLSTYGGTVGITQARGNPGGKEITMEEIELKPCPFCGGKGVEILEDENKYCKKFTPWIPASVRLPKELEPVNVVLVNHNPAPYYRYMKDVPQKATAVYYREAWYWWSCVCEDVLAEYGTNEMDQVDDDIEITHWMPLPEPPEEGGAENG